CPTAVRCSEAGRPDRRDSRQGETRRRRQPDRAGGPALYPAQSDGRRTTMSATVDLRQLAVDRATEPHRSRHIVSGYLMTALILIGFLSVAGWAARESLLPARSVTVVPVLATRAEVQREGAPLFLAAGWIEPRPTPILVTAIAEGVIDQLLVVEGQEVQAG